MTVTSFES